MENLRLYKILTIKNLCYVLFQVKQAKRFSFIAINLHIKIAVGESY